MNPILSQKLIIFNKSFLLFTIITLQRRSLAPSSTGVKSFSSPLLEPERAVRKCRANEDDNEEGKVKPRVLVTSDYESKIADLLSKPFRVPIPDYVPDYHTTRSLGMRRSVVRRALHDPMACNALVLYTPPETYSVSSIESKFDFQFDPSKDQKPVHVVVDPVLGNILRPHQREGVQFMFDCVTGVKGNFQGCIMADEMGLGKTLQCITLIWTLLRQGPDCKPTISKVVIVCPSSLVKNWNREFAKWLGYRINCFAVDNQSKEETTRLLEQYMANKQLRSGTPVLIISYETFRNYSEILNGSEVGMVLCDEGHRLKNCENLTYQSLMGLQTNRRVLLSGTPIQNDLTEYFSLVHFVNPGLLGTAADFRKQYENPILRGQNADSTEKEQEKAQERVNELLTIVNQCMIRRTSALLTKYLPIKFEMVVCVKLSQLQRDLYKSFLESDAVRKIMATKDGAASKTSLTALSNITALKKLCNHPDLVYDKIMERADGFEKAMELLPAGYTKKELYPELSGKLMLLDYMLADIRTNTDDKVVLVSNYTQTLDLFEKLSRKR